MAGALPMVVAVEEERGTAPATGEPVASPRAAEARRRTLLDWAVVGAYALAISLVTIRHEPWFDEAQAWLLARDAGPWDLFAHRLRYEGSPGLWHLILMPFAQAHLPYRTISVISIVIAVAGTAVFVRRSPFTAPIRYAIPFTYFLFYQYGVVARSYCLVGILLFLIAVIHERRREHIWTYVALCALLANVSAHGLVIAASLVGLHLIDLRTLRPRLSGAEMRRQLLAVGAFAGVAALVVAIIWPPADVVTRTSPRFELHWFRVTAGDLLLSGFTSTRILTAAVLLASLWWLWRARCLLLFLVPFTGLLVFSTLEYHFVHHAGILFLVWVFALWIAYERRPPSLSLPEVRRGGLGGLSRDTVAALVALGALGVTVLVQLSWSARTARYDWSHPYSGSQAVASYIADHRIDTRRVALTTWSGTAVQPYFDRNLFIDSEGGDPGRAYWNWSKKQDQTVVPAEVLALAPDYILVTVRVAGSLNSPADYPGYRVVGFFDGDLYFEARLLEPEAFFLLERSR